MCVGMSFYIIDFERPFVTCKIGIDWLSDMHALYVYPQLSSVFEFFVTFVTTITTTITMSIQVICLTIVISELTSTYFTFIFLKIFIFVGFV